MILISNLKNDKIFFQNISYFLILGIIITLLSCGWQSKTNNSTTQAQTKNIGEIVSELYPTIWSIYQDKKGNYWFGSNGKGVFNYDGKKIINFSQKNGLVGNQIRGIQGDKFGNIYFDTPDGISKYDGKKFTTLKPIFSSENKWKSKPDDLWFKGDGNINGVFRYDGKSLFHLPFPEQDLEKYLGLENEKSLYSPYGVYSINKDKEGNLWFGTLAAGVYRFDGNSFLWIGEKELSKLEDGRVPGVRSIIEDKEGNFWLSNILHRYQIIKSDNGKVNYKKLEGMLNSENRKEVTLPYFMSAVTDDEKGDLWMLTYSDGVWRYDGNKFSQYLIKDGKKEVLLFSIYKDNHGILWLGTHNAGVYKYNGSDFEKFIPLK